MRYPYAIRPKYMFAGKVCGKKFIFGKNHRFAVAPVVSGFSEIVWFLWDANLIDIKTGLAAVVRQSATFDDAVSGLEDENASD